MDIIPDKNEVLKLLGCREGDMIYESVSSEYDALFRRAQELLEVRRYICADEGHIYVIITAGAGISGYSEELFKKGEGLAGLIVNAIADSVLFEADTETAEEIKYLCARMGKGIRERREAPETMPISEQRVILEKTGAADISLTDGMMFSPVKTMGYELTLTDDEGVFRSQHDCSVCAARDCPRRIKSSGKRFEIVTAFDYRPSTASGICIDIGTTTIAAMKFRDGKMIGSNSELNAQRRFGADVLSRIEAANHGRGAELRAIIEYQLRDCVKKLGGSDGRIIIAANTVMKSLLMGHDCTSLGVYPFRAQTLENERLGMLDDAEAIGGISAFVGGDILSGLYMCGFDEAEEIKLFIDLGTNGEMAVGNRERILCTSTAAGPAFEGGRISCGTGSVEGAISSVSLKTGTVKTIGDKPPCGICGSGIIELMAELLDVGIADDTGLLTGCTERGYKAAEDIYFTQRDVRELQTAKSAVRAGIELLIKRSGIEKRDIKNVFLAGGFGKRLNIEKACRIGLLPPELSQRCIAVGNSSLGGAVKLLEHRRGMGAIDRIKAVSEDLALADAPEFADMFMRYMDFR